MRRAQTLTRQSKCADKCRRATAPCCRRAALVARQLSRPSRRRRRRCACCSNVRRPLSGARPTRARLARRRCRRRVRSHGCRCAFINLDRPTRGRGAQNAYARNANERCSCVNEARNAGSSPTRFSNADRRREAAAVARASVLVLLAADDEDDDCCSLRLAAACSARCVCSSSTTENSVVPTSTSSSYRALSSSSKGCRDKRCNTRTHVFKSCDERLSRQRRRRRRRLRFVCDLIRDRACAEPRINIERLKVATIVIIGIISIIEFATVETACKSRPAELCAQRARTRELSDHSMRAHIWKYAPFLNAVVASTSGGNPRKLLLENLTVGKLILI